MTVSQLSLSKNQVNSIDRFLIAGTRNLLKALETTFEFSIDSSSSEIEIIPTVNIQNIEDLRSHSLYVISSELEGELNGSLHLLMRAIDYTHLVDVLEPTLRLLLLSSPDDSLVRPRNQKPDGVHDFDKSITSDSAFNDQMESALIEVGNLLFGNYTNAIYSTYDLYTHHSSPVSRLDTDHQTIQQILSEPKLLDRQHFLIRNEFSILDKLIKIWCLISPSRKSFQEILDRIG